MNDQNGQNQFDGILLIDKPSGITSHDVVARLRKILQMKKIGHAGTLDPMATGLMILLVGKATKLSQYLMSLGKEYTGTATLGATTDSQDADGEILETKEVPALTAEEVQTHMDSFLGDQYQIPPMFSAIKKNGVPLYKMARKGKTIEREARIIRVSDFELTGFESPHVHFRILSSKGTYVRTIAHDLGQKIGCGAHLTALRRTQIDTFTIEQAVTLEKLAECTTEEKREYFLPANQVIPEQIV